MLGRSSHWPSIWWSKYYFDRLKIKQWVAGLDLEHSKVFISIHLKLKKDKKMKWSPLNFGVKIKAVENVKLYRNSWVANFTSYTGGELWKSWHLKMYFFHFLPFADFPWLVDVHEIKIRIESPNLRKTYVWWILRSK